MTAGEFENLVSNSVWYKDAHQKFRRHWSFRGWIMKTEDITLVIGYTTDHTLWSLNLRGQRARAVGSFDKRPNTPSKWVNVPSDEMLVELVMRLS
jgi:hypothetical protein